MPVVGDPFEEYPQQAGRTRGFTLGLPRSFTVSPDGARVAFLRTRAGDDPVSCLWVLDVGPGLERLVLDPRDHAVDEDEATLSDALSGRSAAFVTRIVISTSAGSALAYHTSVIQ